MVSPHTRAVGMGFLIFFIIQWVNFQFIVPIVSAPLGGFLTFFGSLASISLALVLAFVWYFVYAFTVKKTGAEPEA